MHLGVCTVYLSLPSNSSLKGKRRIVRSIIDRVSNRFNISIAEVDMNENWRLAAIGFACITNEKSHAQEIVSRVIHFIEESRLDFEILDCQMEIITAS